MFQTMDLPLQGSQAVRLAYPDGFLNKNRPRIHLFRDKMGCDTGRFYARLERVSDRAGAFEIRQKRRMNVYNFVAVNFDEIGAENPHEAGQRDNVHFLAL